MYYFIFVRFLTPDSFIYVYDFQDPVQKTKQNMTVTLE